MTTPQPASGSNGEKRWAENAYIDGDMFAEHSRPREEAAEGRPTLPDWAMRIGLSHSICRAPPSFPLGRSNREGTI